MKTLIVIPIVVAAALAAAGGLCRLAGVPLHGRDLFLAAAVAVVAAEAGMIPAILLRRNDPSIRAQAALGGTVMHMLLTILMASAVMVAKVVEPSAPFVLWLTAAYWLSLVLLVRGLIRLAAPNPLNAK
jgi:hypothetical protein